MPQPEQETAYSSPEYLAKRADRRRDRRHRIGEHVFASFTLLPEVETSFDRVHDYLQSKIIGQDAAIEAIIGALDRSEVRASGDTRPIANLAFLGPTGVGKTETAKAISEIAIPFSNLVRIDCSNFSHGHEVASLIGSPPGYVGRDQKPILNPERIDDGAVILFDEIEKGSPQLYNLLLQIMDNGQLELNNGDIVSFDESIIIMTSNLGAKEMAREASGAKTGFAAAGRSVSDHTTIESAALKSFKQFFSPEFVNRLDNLVVFHPLDTDALHEVLQVKLGALNKEYMQQYGAYVSLSRRASQYLVEKAAEESGFGVRPLVRALDNDIAAPFGRYTAHERIPDGTHVHVYHRDELDGEIAQFYRDDLIFGTRPDDFVRKPIVESEPDEEEVPELASVDADPDPEPGPIQIPQLEPDTH